MAKIILPVNFKDDILAEGMNGRRKYQMITNDDGTVSFVDVTEYTQVGSDFGQAQINATNEAVNMSADKDSIIDTKKDLMSNTEEGKIAGALATKDLISELTEKFVNGAGAHNSVYRGKFLGTSVTDAQYKSISDGMFTDLYIGDYWTINGVNYRIASFDYYLNTGDTKCDQHHAVIVPDTILYNAQMNTSNVTTGGYIGSAMYKSNLEQAKTTIKNAFGSAHVLTKRELLTNDVSNNVPSGWDWLDSQVDLMNEVQVYGSIVWGAHDGNGYNVASVDGQFPLFMFDRTKVHIRQDYWLRDVSSAANFAFVGGAGFAGVYISSASIGVRPAFCIG